MNTDQLAERRKGRRLTASAMIANYRAKYAIERGHQCTLHDDVVFAIIDGATVLDTSYEQANYVITIMAHTNSLWDQFSVRRT